MMSYPHRRRSPREAGYRAQAGGLSARRDYTKEAGVADRLGPMTPRPAGVGQGGIP